MISVCVLCASLRERERERDDESTKFKVYASFLFNKILSEAQKRQKAAKSSEKCTHEIVRDSFLEILVRSEEFKKKFKIFKNVRQERFEKSP